MANGILNLENSGMTAGGGFLLGKIEWSAAANEAENASSVTAALYVKKGGTATLATTGMWNARLTVAGETAAVQIAATVGTEWVKLAEKTVRAAHSASGSGGCAPRPRKPRPSSAPTSLTCFRWRPVSAQVW